jgi:Lhr-like helicase
MVSIGLPEKAQALIQHLELEKYGTHTMLYVDDVHNTIYDALQLNRGLQRTFFHIATPFSFLQRIKMTASSQKSSNDGSMMNLMNVLAKWKDGTTLLCVCVCVIYTLLDEIITLSSNHENVLSLFFYHWVYFVMHNSDLYTTQTITGIATRWDICIT